MVCTGSKCDPQTKANGVILPRDITGKACNQAPDSFLEGGGGGRGGGCRKKPSLGQSCVSDTACPSVPQCCGTYCAGT